MRTDGKSNKTLKHKHARGTKLKLFMFLSLHKYMAMACVVANSHRAFEANVSSKLFCSLVTKLFYSTSTLVSNRHLKSAFFVCFFYGLGFLKNMDKSNEERLLKYETSEFDD